jgi:hypothetical protein
MCKWNHKNYAKKVFKDTNSRSLIRGMLIIFDGIFEAKKAPML